MNEDRELEAMDIMLQDSGVEDNSLPLISAEESDIELMMLDIQSETLQKWWSNLLDQKFGSITNLITESYLHAAGMFTIDPEPKTELYFLHNMLAIQGDIYRD